jgi:hypothetical protein
MRWVFCFACDRIERLWQQLYIKLKNITFIDGTEIEIIPLKIKYLREFMEAFEDVKNAKNDDEAIDFLG